MSELIKSFQDSCDGAIHPEGTDEIFTCFVCLEDYLRKAERQRAIDQIWNYYYEIECGDDGCSFGCQRRELAIRNVARMLTGEPPEQYESELFDPLDEEEIRSEERHKLAGLLEGIKGEVSWDFELQIEQLVNKLKGH